MAASEQYTTSIAIKTLRNFGRAAGGAVVFSLPMLMTMGFTKYLSDIQTIKRGLSYQPFMVFNPMETILKISQSRKLAEMKV